MAFIAIHQARIEAHLASILQHHCINTPIQAAMQYSLLNGGKRIRALLTYAAGAALGIGAATLDNAAAAIECVHCYSLIHDDLPAMDDDDMRRGKPSCHKAFDEANAILTGDALLTLAFEILCIPQANIVPAQQLQMVQCISRAAGATGMISGQAKDIALTHTTPPSHTLTTIHTEKTGRLFQAAIALGCIPHTNYKANTAIGEVFGLAYQLQDDLLEYTSTSEVIGKSSGSDAKNGTPTLVDTLGIEGAKNTFIEQYKQTEQYIKTCFAHPEPLLEVLNFSVQRPY